MTGRRLRLWFVACGSVIVLVAVACGVTVWTYTRLSSPYSGWAGDSVDVDLPQGTSAAAMFDGLKAAGVLRDPAMLRGWIALTGGGARLQAGEYRFDRPIAPLEVLDRLRRGDVLLHPVTIPEGLVLEEIARRFVDAGLASYDRLVDAFRDPRGASTIDPDATDLEGYLYPETYRFPRDASAERIAENLVARFREAIGEGYTERARAVGLGVRQAVILASMIERETSVPEERRRISRVFHNRLRRGMRMQCDPTVLYALHRAGLPVTSLSRAHLGFDSPWNTYRVEGLPVGPIANPGKASLDAAVDPGPGLDLYFVAKPGGGHRFSRTLDGHLAAVAEWRAYSVSSR